MYSLSTFMASKYMVSNVRQEAQTKDRKMDCGFSLIHILVNKVT